MTMGQSLCHISAARRAIRTAAAQPARVSQQYAEELIGSGVHARIRLLAPRLLNLHYPPLKGRSQLARNDDLLRKERDELLRRP